jgi:Ca2+-binding EF-hand superfamily protein
VRAHIKSSQYVARQLTEAIHDSFKSFDADRSGTLDKSELIMAFGSMVRGAPLLVRLKHYIT